MSNLLIVYLWRYTKVKIGLWFEEVKGGDIMTVNDLIGIIGNVGFPVAVSAYLLIRLEKQINSLASSINRLNNIISAKVGMIIDNTNENP